MEFSCLAEDDVNYLLSFAFFNSTVVEPFFLKKKTEIFFYKYWTIGHSVHLTTTTYTVKELQIFYFHDFLSKNYVKLIYHKTTKVQNDFTIYFVSESELVFILHCVV